MRVRVFEGSVGDSATASTHQVQEGQSIVFLTPSVLNPVLFARFYDSLGEVHQVPAASILSIDPDSPPLRLPVRYLDPETGKEIAALRADVDRLLVTTQRLGPRPMTPEEEAERASRVAQSIAQAVEKQQIQQAVAEAPPVDRSKQCTTNGRPVAEVRASQTNDTGMHDGYIVLCEDERAKGFVRPYRDAYKHLSCGTVTTMGRALSETYARDPSFYGATFCVRCNRHLPVAEFVWTADGQPVGS